MGDPNGKPPIAPIGLTPQQQSIFDAGIADLRERLERRKMFMRLPSMNARTADITRLRRAVALVEKAAKPFLDGPAGYLSEQTHQWLLEAEAVAEELRKLATPPKSKVLARGMTRPNEYRTWLIGEEIPALYGRVFEGARLPITVGATGAKGRRGIEFVRCVLGALGEPVPSDDTLKTFMSDARRRVRTGKKRA
jgi:hypothetical protein